MVFYFTSEQKGQKWLIFMGRDKFENEDLIKYGIEQDVWYVHTARFCCACGVVEARSSVYPSI
jgi:NADH:ubiquinone oxidoreductase subunit B-like Fe-S oxidoreductase